MLGTVITVILYCLLFTIKYSESKSDIYLHFLCFSGSLQEGAYIQVTVQLVGRLILKNLTQTKEKKSMPSTNKTKIIPYIYIC